MGSMPMTFFFRVIVNYGNSDPGFERLYIAMGDGNIWGTWALDKAAPYKATAAGLMDANPGGIKAGGNIGRAAIFSFSSSASWSLLDLALRFWNQILTWVSVRFKDAENSALSAMDRYCFCRNFLSSASSCCVVNGVLGFLLALCFRNVTANFGGLGLLWPVGLWDPEIKVYNS